MLRVLYFTESVDAEKNTPFHNHTNDSKRQAGADADQNIMEIC
jgi:hypothetical protein